MAIQFHKSYEYTWAKDTTSTKILVPDHMQIVDADDALGNSTLVEQNIREHKTNNQNWQMATISLVMICVYSYIIFRFFRPIKQLFKTNISVISTLSNVDNPSRDFNQFIKISKFLVFYSIVIPLFLTVKKITTIHLDYQLITILALTIAIFTIYGIRMLLSKIAGKITQTQPFFENIDFIHTSDLAIMAIVLTPMSILMPFYEPLYFIALYAIAAMALYMTIRIYLTISGKKFSFMQWFLYLCGVEITPILVVIATVIVVNNSLLR